MNASKEAALVIYHDKEPVAIVKRDEVSKKTILYALKEMCMDDIESLINKGRVEEIKEK